MHFTWCTTFSKNLNKNIVWKDLHVWLRLWMVPGGLLFWLFLYSSCSTMGYYRKKRGVWLGTIFFGKTPEICRYVTLPLEIQDKTRFHFCKVMLAIPLENSRTKNQGHWKFQIFFLSPLEILHLFKLTFGNSAFYFFVTHRNFMPSSRPVCYFLGIAQS